MENEQKEEHGVCYYASMLLWRIIMTLLSVTFSAFFVNFLIKIFVKLHSGKSIGGRDKFNIFLALSFAIIFIPLTFFFLLLCFLELKNMFGALRVRRTQQGINFTTLSEQLAEEQWQRRA
ncbi:hypothetical protein RND71_022037 [Anisodus tanguticus]|uniref:Uncharacterized protein n=1 Tax=Anisodus tanguticus TaxID=243964 RepID=A0AAE1RZ82_9SOLA|nr:hypothetical protein RND71_022037 [Anisodus tanguticus]